MALRRRIGDGASRLRTLLDALEADLLAAPVAELLAALGETGRARDSACEEVRSLLGEAVLASVDEAPVAVSPDAQTQPGLTRH